MSNTATSTQEQGKYRACLGSSIQNAIVFMAIATAALGTIGAVIEYSDELGSAASAVWLFARALVTFGGEFWGCALGAMLGAALVVFAVSTALLAPDDATRLVVIAGLSLVFGLVLWIIGGVGMSAVYTGPTVLNGYQLAAFAMFVAFPKIAFFGLLIVAVLYALFVVNR